MFYSIYVHLIVVEIMVVNVEIVATRKFPAHSGNLSDVVTHMLHLQGEWHTHTRQNVFKLARFL